MHNYYTEQRNVSSEDSNTNNFLIQNLKLNFK